MELTDDQHLDFAHAYFLDTAAEFLINKLPNIMITDDDAVAIQGYVKRMSVDIFLTPVSLDSDGDDEFDGDDAYGDEWDDAESDVWHQEW